MRDRFGPLRRVVDVTKRWPDDKHDTRYLECGHSRPVPTTRLHPLRARCGKCKEKQSA